MNTDYNEGRQDALDDARHDAGCAIDELRRWQYSDDLADVRHSIDAAIRMLERI